jgi:hypothetical protein
VILGS